MVLTVPHIDELLQPGADALGYELVAVELGGGETSIVRIYIDSPDGITVDDCARASRQFSAILDVADPISNRYTLEVSSPGLDRPLAKPEHFVNAVGRGVKVKMRGLINGRRRFSGNLIEATKTFAVVEVDGEQTELPYDEMDRARLVPVFDFDI